MKRIRGICAAIVCLTAVITAHPAAVFAEDSMPERKVIFIGDSRTVEMYGNVNEVNIAYDIFMEDARGDFWAGRIGAKYDWMIGTGIPVAETQICDGAAIVILMGVNDCVSGTSAETAMQYADTINMKAEEWKLYGADTYVVSVNPVDGDYYFYNVMINNASIKAFNEVMKAQLSEEVTYIDTYSQILDTFVSPDQLHYDNATYLDIYHRIMAALPTVSPRKNQTVLLRIATAPEQSIIRLGKWKSCLSQEEQGGNALLYGCAAGFI